MAPLPPRFPRPDSVGSWCVEKKNKTGRKLGILYFNFELEGLRSQASKPAFTYLKLTTEALEQGVKYVQS